MARLPARVDWIVHDRTRTKVALRLDKSSMTFQAEWAGKTYRDKDGAILRKKIIELIEASECLVFHPVIKVELPPGGRFSGGDRMADVAIRLSRFHYAEGNSGLLRAKWGGQENKQLARHWNPGKNFSLPYHVLGQHSWNSDCHYLAYSDDLWAGLTVLLDTIEQARERITQLLSADDVVLRLETVGAEFIKALPAPKENGSE